MKTALTFALGVLTGLAFSRIPHYAGPLFNDTPPTPDDHQPKYAIGGRYVDREQFNDYWRPRDSGRPTYEESVA